MQHNSLKREKCNWNPKLWSKNWPLNHKTPFAWTTSGAMLPTSRDGEDLQSTPVLGNLGPVTDWRCYFYHSGIVRTCTARSSHIQELVDWGLVVMVIRGTSPPLPTSYKRVALGSRKECFKFHRHMSFCLYFPFRGRGWGVPTCASSPCKNG